MAGYKLQDMKDKYLFSKIRETSYPSVVCGHDAGPRLLNREPKLETDHKVGTVKRLGFGIPKSSTLQKSALK